ncbi:S66 peptidase family protein [Cesiribacter andamanensis]|uniref:Murein tetrapeptide carboxypeptidase n=1 Tax=Cesiribacter andamanensis AMV16 TaxID=1279009 RepID=M7N535_9BACT|nr:LD-carboxypeptidase [Cesiribacter andamanensis]EMR03743.1 Murein tetrapeptide carboxypeptidase [Cesiribacter andamanensis AMV16]
MQHPPYLQPGDTIAITSTARWTNPEALSRAIRQLQDWGFRVVLGAHLYRQHQQFAGSDGERLQEFQRLLDDPAIKAILFSRGGYGTTRIIDQIDWTSFMTRPKWLCGFSDVTALLCQAYRLGVQSLHCTMAAGFDDKPGRAASIESIRQQLLGQPLHMSAAAHPLNRTGRAAGPLLGGNLSLLATLVGTPTEPKYEGAILFLEDLDEYRYHLDRMMVQLKRAGRLAQLKGLVVGQMSDMRDNPVPFGREAYEIIQEHVSDYAYPVAFGFPVGHEALNLALPVGAPLAFEVFPTGASLQHNPQASTYV